ncbi:FAD-dependent oxidoreductase [Streptomyces violascens]|nr:FAD-dependent oxidoreductase [Streptomyces violascens]
MTASPEPTAPAHHQAMRILVVGGGLSGLATAVALGERGHHVLVLEQAPQFTGGSVGVRLTPHTFQALDLLGVGDAVREQALPINEFHVMHGSTSELLASVPLAVSRGQRRYPHATAHHVDLYEPLLEACRRLDSVQLCAASRVIGYTQHSESVVVTLADGHDVTSDALILTAGAHPLASDDLHEGGGQLASYSTVIPMDLVADRWHTDAATCWVGADWHVSHHPMPDYRYLGLTATRHHHVGELPGRVDLEHVLAAFPDIGYSVRNILTLGQHWRTSLHGRLKRSGRDGGRVALVGAAGYQEACPLAVADVRHAVADAVVLGTSWDRSGGSVHHWFADYDSRRGESAHAIPAVCASACPPPRPTADQAPMGQRCP